MPAARRLLLLHPLLLLALALAAAGCRTPVELAASPPPAAIVLPPTATRGEFTIEVGALDTWNAIGQIAVRTPGVTYDGRAQMLDLYALRYRGVEFMVLAKAVPASDTITRLTTRVTATTADGKPLDSGAVAELLALFQRELPAEIASVRARQAAEQRTREAKQKSKSKRKPRS